MNDVRKAVFDCNTLLQGLASPDGPAGACVQLVLSGRVLLFVSAFVLEELRDVTARPAVMAKLRLSPARSARFIEAIETSAVVVDSVPSTFSYARDPDDAHYVNLAITCGAMLVVTRDKDLLDLMNDSNADGRTLRASYPDLRVFAPPQFLQVVHQR